MKLKIAIIGCGLIAQERHAPELSANPMADVAGFFDPWTERAEQCAQKYGGKVYKSYQEVLEDEEVAGVVICTSNDSHCPMSVEALKADKYVLCEKPVATTLEDARKIAEAQKESKAFFMAAQNQRFHLAHRKAKELIEDGTMGKVLSFRCTLAHQGPEYYGFGRNRNTWYLNKSASGLGCVTDLGIHKCDMLIHVLGERFKKVSAFAGVLDKTDEEGKPIEVYDNAVAILETESGVMGTMNLSYTNYSGMDNSTIFYCQNGIIKAMCDDECPLEVIMFYDKEKSCYYNKLWKDQKNESGVMKAFVNAICNRTGSPIPIEESIHAIETVCAIDESARTKTLIEI